MQYVTPFFTASLRARCACTRAAPLLSDQPHCKCSVVTGACGWTVQALSQHPLPAHLLCCDGVQVMHAQRQASVVGSEYKDTRDGLYVNNYIYQHFFPGPPPPALSPPPEGGSLQPSPSHPLPLLGNGTVTAAQPPQRLSGR